MPGWNYMVRLFFEMLDRFVQREPWLERDKVMIDALNTAAAIALECGAGLGGRGREVAGM
jgi:hypothetical protein